MNQVGSSSSRRSPQYRVGSSDPLNANAYRTQRGESPEDLWQPLYDRVNITNGSDKAVTSQSAFFSTAKGQTANLIVGTAVSSISKSYRDTNMENSNVVPTKLFKFIGISLAYFHADRDNPGNAQDREAIRDGGYFHFRIVDKDILYLPISAIPEMNPAVAVATTATATSIFGTAGGGGANVSMYKLPIPITLKPYENFTVTLNFTTAATFTLANSMDIMMMLQGYMRRPT